MKWFSSYPTRKATSAQRPRIQLRVEALDDRVLLSSGPSLLGHIPATHIIPGNLSPVITTQVQVLQAPNLVGQRVNLSDPAGNGHGTLTIRTQNSDGTFSGDFNGGCVTGFITFGGISFTRDSGAAFAFDEMVGLPIIQTGHIGYSGSLHYTAAGYTTTGWLNESTALCYENNGVCTYILGTRQETTFSVSGTFASSLDPLNC